MTIDEAMQVAVSHHAAGRLADAESIYRQVLAAMPAHSDALHLLGVLTGQRGNLQAGIELIRKAIAAAGTGAQPHYFNNQGNLLLALGRQDEAVAAYHEAVRRAGGAGPGAAEYWNNLANAYRVVLRLDEAIAASREAVRLLGAEGPSPIGGAAGWAAPALAGLGAGLAMKGQFAEAIGCFERALRIRPGMPEAEGYLGYALREAGRVAEAEAVCREIVAKRPADAAGWKNLGLALDAAGKNEEAMGAYRRALELGAAMPGGAGERGLQEALSGLANGLMRGGEIEEAVSLLKSWISRHADDVWVHSNLLYALHLDPRVNAMGLLEEHQAWERRHAAGLRPAGDGGFAAVREPGKRLKVGYVSADMRDHPVGRFLLPLVKGHVREDFEVVAYSDTRFPDAITNDFRAACDVWRDVGGLTDAALAEMVRRDGIDVLVDLSMHAGHNRMLMFARKPAPVQVTYLAYPGTTGLSTMDWRISDRFIDPTVEGQISDKVPLNVYTERTWRLTSYWCYVPMAAARELEVGSSPAAREGVVTFGCLNNFSKVGRQVVEVWGRILSRVERSRLILHAKEGRHRERVRRQLEQAGIARERITFVGMQLTREYLATYGNIDVGLDPFPYCGGTTTCEALWMGVPVVSLAGETAVGRGGASILGNIGLSELVTGSAEKYAEVAVDLARDVGQLARLRSEMRSRMESSALMDVAGFVNEVEGAYRGMWEKYCMEG